MAAWDDPTQAQAAFRYLEANPAGYEIMRALYEDNRARMIHCSRVREPRDSKMVGRWLLHLPGYPDQEYPYALCWKLRDYHLLVYSHSRITTWGRELDEYLSTPMWNQVVKLYARSLRPTPADLLTHHAYRKHRYEHVEECLACELHQTIVTPYIAQGYTQDELPADITRLWVSQREHRMHWNQTLSVDDTPRAQIPTRLVNSRLHLRFPVIPARYVTDYLNQSGWTFRGGVWRAPHPLGVMEQLELTAMLAVDYCVLVVIEKPATIEKTG